MMQNYEDLEYILNSDGKKVKKQSS
jgi:hypothetical protein